mgnify:CR=1 FL=1
MDQKSKNDGVEPQEKGAEKHCGDHNQGGFFEWKASSRKKSKAANRGKICGVWHDSG